MSVLGDGLTFGDVKAKVFVMDEALATFLVVMGHQYKQVGTDEIRGWAFDDDDVLEHNIIQWRIARQELDIKEVV